MNKKYNLLKDLASFNYYIYKYNIALTNLEKEKIDQDELDYIKCIKSKLFKIEQLINDIIVKIEEKIKLEDNGFSKKY